MLIRAVAVLQADAHQFRLVGPLRVLVRQSGDDPLHLRASCRIADGGGDGFKVSNKTPRFIIHDKQPENLAYHKRMPGVCNRAVIENALSAEGARSGIVSLG